MTTTTPQPTATGLPDGGLHTRRIGALDFETGGHLPEVEIAYETWGTLNAEKSNAVLVLHALTGSTHVAASSGDPEEGWWEGVVGPGCPIDTNTWFVIAPNILGGCYGSTGPSSLDPEGTPWGSRFPFTTIRDSVHAEARLADALGIERFQAVIGGSMGGARALEWATAYPDRVAGMAVIACGAHSTAEQIAFAQAQVQSITLDPNFRGGDYYPGPTPDGGLGIARKIAHITYRSEPDMVSRFGRAAQPEENPFGEPVRRQGRYQVESYLDYQAAKLIKRFDANSYLVLTEALMSHDVSRGRGTEAEVLGSIQVTPFIAAVESDRLYFPGQSQELARQLPGDVPVHMIDSPIGHDGFLTDLDQVAAEMTRVLGL
ncbi:homoserine O-acetyltransferase [Citricoccus sp. NPDC079358]|uniref:homoserine O-acetyltransferase MetX n=1 Tax=Citricoccus sp. NPDC079358 TaxID=3154653 RepID=UPI00344C0193